MFLVNSRTVCKFTDGSVRKSVLLLVMMVYFPFMIVRFPSRSFSHDRSRWVMIVDLFFFQNLTSLFQVFKIGSCLYDFWCCLYVYLFVYDELFSNKYDEPDLFDRFKYQFNQSGIQEPKPIGPGPDQGRIRIIRSSLPVRGSLLSVSSWFKNLGELLFFLGNEKN